MTDIPESLKPFVTKKSSIQLGQELLCKPQAIFQPRNVEEIQELIKQARLHGKTIMTVGSGHSPSDLTMTTEWLCNLDKFNHVLLEEPYYAPKSPTDDTLKSNSLT